MKIKLFDGGNDEYFYKKKRGLNPWESYENYSKLGNLNKNIIINLNQFILP